MQTYMIVFYIARNLNPQYGDKWKYMLFSPEKDKTPSTDSLSILWSTLTSQIVNSSTKFAYQPENETLPLVKISTDVRINQSVSRKLYIYIWDHTQNAAFSFVNFITEIRKKNN